MKVKKINTAFLNIARSTSSPIANFIITLFGIQAFGATNWGEFVAIQLLVLLAVFTANWGNKEYLLRAYSERPKEIGKLFRTSLSTRLLLLTPVLFIAILYSLKITFLALIYAIAQHLYGSLESLVTYFHKFKQFLIAEFIGFGVIVFGFCLMGNFSLNWLLIIFCCSLFLKLTVLLYACRGEIGILKFSIDYKLLFASFPFFLIGLSGWIQSRIDLYLVDIFLESQSLAKYRVLSTAFILIQSVSALAIYPYVKHLYRLTDETIKKGKILIGVIGIPIVLFGTIIAYFIMEFGIHSGYSNWVYCFAGVSALPSFLYMVDIFKFYKIKQEKMVMKINFIGAFINLSISLWLIQILGVLGAIIGTCINQWAVLVLFKYFIRNEYSVSRN